MGQKTCNKFMRQEKRYNRILNGEKCNKFMRQKDKIEF